MSDTPETDKYCGEDLWIGEPALVSSDFARKLERERNNLKQEVEHLKTMSVCELGAHNNSVRDYMEHWEGRALIAERERDESLNVLREINVWINVAAMRPPTPNEAAHAINTWGDKIRPILEVTE